MEMDAAAIISNPNPVSVPSESKEEMQQQEAKNIVAGESGPTSSQEPTPTPEAAKPKDEFVSPRLALLAKEEKRLQEERKRLAEERKNPEYAEYLEFKKLKANAKNNPLEIMEKFGLTYDELTDYVISGKHSKDPSVRALEEKIAKMEAESREREEKTKKEIEQSQIAALNENIKATCLKASDQFDLVNTWGAYNLVYNVMQEHYNKTQEVLEIDKAAEKVEAYLEKESQKYQSSKKLRKLFGVQESVVKKEEDDNYRAEPTTRMTTLGNSASAGSTSTDDESYDTHTLLAKAAKLLSR